MRRILAISVGAMLVFGMVGIASGAGKEPQEKQRAGQEVSPAKPDLPEEASEKAKVKLEKVWERKFDEGIEDFSVTNDGRKILVSLRNGDKHFISRSGKVIKRQKGKRGRALKNGRFITIDGEILDSNGNIESKIKLLPPDIEYPISSPNGKYTVVFPSYDADYIFLKIYNTKTGQLLWKYSYGSPGILVTSFIKNDKIAVYARGRVMVYHLQSGEKIWETRLIEDETIIRKETFEEAELSSSKQGHVAVYHRLNDTLYSLSPNGVLAWKYREGKMTRAPSLHNIKVSNKGNFLIALGRKIYFFDNKTGNIVWEKNYRPRITSIRKIDISQSDNYIFISGYIGSYKQTEKCHIYLLDKDGEVRWQLKTQAEILMLPGLQVSDDEENLIIHDRESLYLFKIGSAQ